MKLRVVSDLHFEFHADHGETLSTEVTSGEFDVLIVAGDLASYQLLSHAICLLAEKTDKPIVYVAGNHEFYGADRRRGMDAIRGMGRLFPHFHALDGEVFEHDGVRFLGAPLWFAKSTAPTWAMNDFTQIDGFASWVYEENARHRAFFRENLRAGDVAVTHYLPAKESVHPEYRGSPLNPFFLCDMEPVIRRTKPNLWVHGHTHKSRMYYVPKPEKSHLDRRSTRVLCNPFGYVRVEENPDFDPCLTVET